MAFAGTVAPTGFLACEGQAVSRTTYATLFTAIGTTWGSGDGSTTFNLPDLRGMFVRGTGTNATGSSSGAVGPSVGAYAADTYLNHNHTATQTAHSHYVQPSGFNGGSSGVYNQPVNYVSDTTISTSSVAPAITVATSTTGGTETKPKNYGVLYIIKT
jgi:microcystin-dependent protein